jgi:hypothetical protein
MTVRRFSPVSIEFPFSDGRLVQYGPEWTERMGSMEPNDEKKAGEAAPEDHRPSNVWRGSPRIWERCILCELKKECASAGVVRGSKDCTDARYSRVRRNI